MSLHELADAEIVPRGHYTLHWRPAEPCRLVDVRLVRVEGPVDIDYVMIGHCIQAAFSRRPRVIAHHEDVRILLVNFGTIGARCGVVLETDDGEGER